ncbi:MAG: hypothetical protein Q7U37_07315 [Gallionella sp.]|nr:hypothetical protein [Gallionella sp.]
MRYLIHIRNLLPALLLLSTTAGAADFSLSVADVDAPAFSARGIRLVLPADGSADLQIANLKLQQREFRNLRVRCGGFTLSSAQMSCRNGRLDAIPDAKLDFSYDFSGQRWQLALVAASGESWRVDGQAGERGWQVSAQLRNAQGKRLSPLLPAGMPLFTQGALNGTVRARGNASGVQTVDADLQLAEIGFSDASGLHAAEKMRGDIKFTANRKGAAWDWQGSVAWQSGEMFWQPLYLSGDNHALSASGRYDGKSFEIEQAVLDLPEVGRMQFSATLQQGRLLQGVLRGDKLTLTKLFENYARPFLAKGALAEAALYGRADVEIQYRNDAVQALRLGLHDVGIADVSQRFTLLGVNSEINWRLDAPVTARIDFAGGALLGVPLQAGQWTVNMKGLDFSVPQAELAILDGKLDLHNLHIYQQADAWRWEFAGSLLPISMEQFSEAAGLPKMLGTLAGRIPRVNYDGNEINVDGALLFNVFDGTVVATHLKLANAFGRSPQLSGDLAMRNLDLDLLTRTFSFGNMQGRLDGDVNNLQLRDWQPSRFDARLYSSAGNYPRKISQRAVQNISALGGAGAAAAIQRSYLRFFENFGYERIGWSCVLRNGVCAMGGIEGSNSGTYAIIKGGGIPAISVMGYNRNVSWRELLTRLKRVTQNNVKPIIK